MVESHDLSVLLMGTSTLLTPTHPNTLNRTNPKTWSLPGSSIQSTHPSLILSSTILILMIFGSISPLFFVRATMLEYTTSNMPFIPYNKQPTQFMNTITKSNRFGVNLDTSKTTQTSKIYNSKLKMSKCFNFFLASMTSLPLFVLKSWPWTLFPR